MPSEHIICRLPVINVVHFFHSFIYDVDVLNAAVVAVRSVGITVASLGLTLDFFSVSYDARR